MTLLSAHPRPIAEFPRISEAADSKGRNSVTRWLNRGLCGECDDSVFSEQINRLDAEISIK